MSSILWYLYEFARKPWVEKFLGAKSEHEIVEKPDRFRDFPVIFPEYCISCGSCTAACPSPQAIKLIRDEDGEFEGKAYPIINQGACIRCGFCAEVCPTDPKSITCGENHFIKEDFTILPSENMYVVDDFLCIKCKKCLGVCPVKGAMNDTDNKMNINQSKCISCGKCYDICPVQGAIKSIHLRDVEDQKKVINYIVETLENFIESYEEEVRDLPSDKILKKKIPVKGIMENSLKLLDNEELVRKILEHQVERLQLRIILWNSDACEKCQSCVGECPTKAISFDDEKDTIVRDKNKCLRCSICYQTCPFGVITYFLAKFELDFVDNEEYIIATIKAFPLN